MSESSDIETKIVKDWLQSDSEDNDSDHASKFQKDHFEGDRGHLRLQLQKTYKGDERFKLDEGFRVDKSDSKLMPADMFGAMSKREKDNLFKAKIKAPKSQPTENQSDDNEGVQWDPEIDLAKEKSKAFDVLAKLVPQSEIFLSSKPQNKNTTQSSQNYSQIRRYDPTKPNLDLVKKPKEEPVDNGRLEVLQKRNQTPQHQSQKPEELEVNKVLEISKSSWMNIIQERREGGSKTKNLDAQAGSFTLDFGDSQPVQKFIVPSKHLKQQQRQKDTQSSQQLEKKREAKAEKKAEVKSIDKKSKANVIEKNTKKDKQNHEDENEPYEKLNVPYDELPRRLKKKMEKRKKKREELKLARKLKINFDMPDEKIFERYKSAYPTMEEDQLRDQIRYQKLIHDAINKQKRKKQ